MMSSDTKLVRREHFGALCCVWSDRSLFWQKRSSDRRTQLSEHEVSRTPADRKQWAKLFFFFAVKNNGHQASTQRGCSFGTIVD
jgi:hypothetical protein